MGVNKRQYLFNQIIAADPTKNTEDVFNGDLEETYSGMVNAGSVPSIGTDKGRELAGTKRHIALREWFRSLSSSDTSPVNVMCLGDSITESKGGSTYSKRWTKILESNLRNAFPVTGVTAPVSAGYVPTAITFTPPGDYPVVLTNGSGFSDNTARGLGVRNYTLNSGGTVVITVTGATSVDVHYWKVAGTRTMGWKVDGGSVTNVDVAYTSGKVDGYVLNIPIPDTGTHTVTISCVSASAIGIEGFYVHTGTDSKGLRVYEGGHASSPVSLFSTGNPAQYLGEITSTLQPSLVVLEFGANDYQQNTFAQPISAAQFKTNLLSLIATIRANCTRPPSIVLMPVWMWQPGITPVEQGGWDAMIQAQYDIAAADPDICIVDLRQRFSLIPTSPAKTTKDLLAADNIHPSDAGNWLIGKTISTFLTP